MGKLRPFGIAVVVAVAALGLSATVESGGVVGGLIKRAGKATGLKPIEKLGKEMDNAHRDFKEAVPAYKRIEEDASTFVQHQFLAACIGPYQVLTNAVMARCANWDGRLDDHAQIVGAIRALIDARLFTEAEFGRVRIRWCPLDGASGMAPDRGRIYLDASMKGHGTNELAALLAHEMTHVRQYERMRTDKFKCAYSREYVECGGCQNRRHSLEREAIDAQNAASETLITTGWLMCNKSNQEAVWVSFAYRTEGAWMSRGWQEIAQGQCSLLIPNVTNRYLYYYAEGSEGTTWGQGDEVCVHPTDRFSLRGEGCPPPYETRPAWQIDTGSSRRWTTNLVD
jgi:uncharacterized membrane protein